MTSTATRLTSSVARDRRAGAGAPPGVTDGVGYPTPCACQGCGAGAPPAYGPQAGFAGAPGGGAAAAYPGAGGVLAAYGTGCPTGGGVVDGGVVAGPVRCGVPPGVRPASVPVG